jgi:hypothetical protein
LGFSRFVEAPFERCAESMLARPLRSHLAFDTPSGRLTLLGPTVLGEDLLEVEARLRWCPLWPASPMRLVLTRWSGDGGTLAELLPSRRPRAGYRYFGAGRAALEALAVGLVLPNQRVRVAEMNPGTTSPATVAA